MPRLIRSSFFHRFAAGFLMGIFGVVVLQPAEAGHFVKTHIVHAPAQIQAQR